MAQKVTFVSCNLKEVKMRCVIKKLSRREQKAGCLSALWSPSPAGVSRARGKRVQRGLMGGQQIRQQLHSVDWIFHQHWGKG